MPASGFDRLLSPRSVAVIGGRVAESVASEMLKLGFAGDIWPVNPNRETMAGLACYASLDALPGVPDATYVGVSLVSEDACVGTPPVQLLQRELE